ncbi:MAG: hypothetical protein FWG87_08330 [Defluviitaleaceae bacterium]|nr:hypothetical protein [Defluviitaleaceae bacterium]
MAQLLIIRETLVKYFKRYEVFIMPFLKLLLGLVIFRSIFSIGSTSAAIEPLAARFSPGLLSMLLALLFTIAPMNLSWLLIIVAVTLQLTANMEVAIAVFIFLMLVFLFYARMAKKESILIIFTLLAFRYNVPYLVPLLAGLYFPITAVIPVTIGVFIYAQTGIINMLMAPAAVASAAAPDRDLTEILTELPSAFSDVYQTLMASMASTHSWLFTALIFAMVIVLVYFVSKQAIDYAKEIALGLGCVMIIFGYIISVLSASGSGIVNIGAMIFGTIVCGIIAFVVKFFDVVLDYQRAESVQFEDDSNYYHVRIVPKIIMTKAQRSVKRIRPQLPENPLEDYNEDSEM